MFDTGDGPRTVVVNATPTINDGHWHDIAVVRTNVLTASGHALVVDGHVAYEQPLDATGNEVSRLHAQSTHFLPRDAVLASTSYDPVSVCLSVCHNPVFMLKSLNKSTSFLVYGPRIYARLITHCAEK